VAKISIPKEDRQWRGRDAARTLAEAERIKNDPMLFKLAMKEAKLMAKEKMEEAQSIIKVAKSTNKKKK
jgi:hypothetical protein